MKNNLLFIVIIIVFTTACQPKPASNVTEITNTSETPATTELADGSYCFQQSIGRDTTSINLSINGNTVSGEMNWIPYEKDGARGTLQGTRNGNEITAIWAYVIEGSDQKEQVMFKIEGDQLLRKVGELEYPNNDGNLKLKDPANAAYSETFSKITCP